MGDEQELGCEYCQDPLTVSMSQEPVRRPTENIGIYQCARCGTLILDDWLGWKGSGVVFHATEEMIERYLAGPEKRD